MLKFKISQEKDVEELNKIAVASEGYWGHSKKMMEAFVKHYTLTPSYIKVNKVFHLEFNGEIIGFYALNISKGLTELEYFYLKPEYIGKGYGRKLWNHLIEFCKSNQIDYFRFVAGPEIKNYYLKMGAKIIDTVYSQLDVDRRIYKFNMDVSKNRL